MISKGLNTTALIIAGTVVFSVVIIAITSVAIAVEDGARAASLIALIVAPLTSLLGMLAMFIQMTVMRKDQAEVRKDVAEVKEHTEAMTNGLGDAKIRANLADVLRPELIDPDALAQLVDDRDRRATAVDAGIPLLERVVDTPEPTHRKDAS